MTQTEAAKWIPLLTAYSQGKTIQIVDGIGYWKDAPSGVSFNYLPSHYRIKPEPRQLFLFKDSFGALTHGWWDTREEAEKWIRLHVTPTLVNDHKIIEFREVLQ